MKKMLIASAVVCAFLVGGCDRKTDAPKPKTGMVQPTSPTSAGRVDPKRVHVVRM